VSSQVVVVGGGVAGLCCAYYLRKHGHEVTVLESNRVGSGASFANGGWLCPSQAGPLPEPGLTPVGIRALFNRDSALYFAPREWSRLAPFLLRFWTYCNEHDHESGTEALARLGRRIFEAIEEMRADGVKFEVHKQGMVYASRQASDAREQLRKLQPMRRYGFDLPDDLLTGDELRAVEPSLAPSVNAGFLVEEHWHVRSDSFCTGLTEVLRRDGAQVMEGAEVFEFVRRNGRITQVRSAAGDLVADAVVLAAGAWTTELARAIGISIPMLAGKGYSFTVHPRVMPSHAVLLGDVHVGCTPFDDGLRIGGTMEFSGINKRLDRRRIETIVDGARVSFLPWESPGIEAEWAGMRPVTADGLPILDRVPRLENTYLATGYSMQGVTLAPTAGRALAEMITTGRRPTLLERFRVDRFGRLPLPRFARNGAR